jgi:transposase InsO family protein
VCGHGSINFHTTVNGIKRTLAVDDVLYVPGLGTSLLSIAAVTDVGLSVHFIETQVFFSKDQTIVMIGERIGKSLYHLAIIPTLCDASQSQFSACFAVPSASYMAIWHQRLTHTSYKTIIKMASDNVVDGLTIPSDKVVPYHPCVGCVAGKMHRSPFPIRRTRANQSGQLIHAYVCGPMHVTTPSGARFFVLFTDEFSGLRQVYFMKQKAKVADFFKKYVNLLRSETNNLVHTLRSDNGGEFISTSFKIWLSEKGFSFESSSPYTPEQNGVAERANLTIFEAGRSLIHARHLPLELWGEAIACAVYVLNRVSNSISSVTPHQKWYGLKPNVSHLRIFGSIAFIHIPKADRRKLDAKSQKCFFVGYYLTQKAYRFWDPICRRIKLAEMLSSTSSSTTFQHLSQLFLFRKIIILPNCFSDNTCH